MRLFVSLLFLLSLSLNGIASVITGRVTNIAGDPLSFANVYIKGTTKGTTTNLEGYYRMEIPVGPCELVFRFIGYKMRVEKLIITPGAMNLDVKLEPENYTLNEIQVRADAEDPAYPIIRKAIENRKKYLNEVDEFSCDVYIKGVQRLTKYPKKILGMDINLDEFIDTTTGIVYLSESVSRYNFKKPDKISETMVSSKVSGSNRAFSFNKASDMSFNFYENNMMVGDLSKRGFISPIAQSAFLYYKYRLDGSFLENGHWVNRIEVIPKRKNDPVFAGYIFIQDSTWRIHSADLFLTKDAQVEFVDTLRIGQVFIPAGENEEIWMLGSATFDFVFSAFGFEGNGNFAGVYSGYEINPGNDKKVYRGGIMKIKDDANKRSTDYWNEIRPVPLTVEEIRDYYKRDSLMVIKESQPYKDSLDRIDNKFKVGKLLAGYTYRNRFKKTEFGFSGLLDNVQFNTVEGLNIGLGVTSLKTYTDRRTVYSKLNVRYGFSNESWQGTGSIRYDYNIKKFGYIQVEGGQDLVQFNESKPISPFINTSYSLFDEKNYMKLYSKQFFAVATRLEPVNGLRFRATAEYAVRDAVVNRTDYSFVDKKEVSYTSNNPIDPINDFPFFEKNEALKISVGVRYSFGQEFIDRPDLIYILGSKYPEIFATWQKGIKDLAGSDVDFDRIEVGIEDVMKLGMLGELKYLAVFGRFLRSEKVGFMDYHHFNGNRTFLSDFQQRRFDLLDYYKYSTTENNVQVFAEHNFGGFIFNKIPGVRRLKLNEIAGFRMLHIPDTKTHYEFSFGLEKLGLIRADYVFAFDEFGNMKSGFVIGLKTNLGR